MYIDRSIAELLMSAIRDGGWLELQAQGRSMFPLLRQGDRCRFIPLTSSALRKGDVVLYYAETEQLVAHRLIGVANRGGVRWYTLKGDANLACDPPVREERLIGKLASIRKRGRSVAADGWPFRLWSGAMLYFPLAGRVLHRFEKKLRRVASRAPTGVFL